ncbi:MAG: Redox-sensing transcriptional repressor Rex [Syntrophorhabdus sp. PtaU1.Bin002]|nr:MAG: Redox-sensing transcriptional repressor Rex [Syntrophorhabdus sp. PtaB.Bin006]OPY69780.1 MAG: Redox-sensing transcriptional repressor Rex [Syntrophorhabdus sp. PtaU1.Bin002]
MAKYAKIPGATIRRLSSYLKALEDLESKSEKVASSALLAEICNVNAAQVRKDFAYFGEFGIRGMGYNVKELKFHIKEILGINREWRIAVVGIGNMGSALLVYKDFLKQNYKIVAAFDIDPVSVIGRISERMGKPVEILPVDRLKEVVKARNIEIGIITTPPETAQRIADMMAETDIKGILNFAPSPVRVHGNVKLRNVFFTAALDNLVYYLSN